MSVNETTIRNCLYKSDPNGQKSYFTSSALVSGREWLASSSKMLLTKTLGLKAVKIVWYAVSEMLHKCTSSVHLVPCSAGPSLRIISRNAGMRFGLKHDFMN